MPADKLIRGKTSEREITPDQYLRFFRQYGPILYTFIIGVIVSFSLYSVVNTWEEDKLSIEFKSRAGVYSTYIQDSLHEYVDLSEFLKDFFQYSQTISRKKFFLLSNSILSRYPGLQAISWNPLIPDEERPAYERRARAEGVENFLFTERTDRGDLVPAGKRKEYVVVYYIEPLDKNRPALGFDAASNPVRHQAIKTAFNTEKPVATDRITLVQETGHQFGTLILNPVYLKNVSFNSKEERNENRKGLVVAVLRIGDAIEKALSDFPDEGILLYLYDVTSEKEAHFLYSRSSPVPGENDQPQIEDGLTSRLHFTKEFDFAGRRWRLILQPSEFYLNSKKSWNKWVAFFGSLCLMALLMSYLYNRLQYIDEIEKRIYHEAIVRTRLTKEISDRKSAQEESARFGRILEQSLNEIYVFDVMTLKFVMVNKGARRNLGYSMEDLLELTPLDIQPEYTPEAFTRLLSAIHTGEKDIIVFNTVHKRKDDTLYDAEVHLQEMSFESHTFLVAFVIDITEKIKTEKKLQQAIKMESIGTLAGGIAHDFNNILTAIMGFSKLALVRAERGSTIEDDINEILHASNRAKDLVWQILSFARQAEEEIHPIRVNVIIKEVLKFLRSSIPSSIEIRHEIKSKSLIMGNSTQVHQILVNLCTNAAYAMENDTGILKISLKDINITAGESLTGLGLRPGDYIQLSVSDTGTGIAPDKIESIFEPYFTTKGIGKGTGLGLSVVHGIVEKYHGKIIAESKLGRGSVFTVYFPVCREDKEKIREEAGEIKSGTECILFVDDEVSIAEIGKRALESLGYSVVTRTSSIEALELFRSKPGDFDMVITDMTMPNMTGDELAMKMMKIRSDIPVILCTGFSNRISETMASEIGIRAFIYKPFIEADLSKIIRKVLDS
ncbi:MAG: CHASE domain-containing protein, partial [Desulfobacterales bacterium]|nr:CHASE domain-containing protein [Desulfobacterales bacterium]